MKKVLLIGELNDVLRSLNEALMTDFQVQMCSVNAKNVKDMIRIVRPSLILFNAPDISSDSMAIVDAIKEKHSSSLFLTIVSKEMEEQMSRKQSDMDKAQILVRPITTTEVAKKCYEMLDTKMEEKPVTEQPIEPVTKAMKKILLVDDNALVLRNIKSLLDSDYEMVLANTGEKAVAVAKIKKPDLILLDYNMPGMNGKETFEKIKMDEEIKDIPVVFLTSVAEKETIMEVLQSKPFGYILKPPTKEKLMQVVREALGE